MPRRSGNISLFWQLSKYVVVALGCHRAGGADKNIIGQAGGQANDMGTACPGYYVGLAGGQEKNAMILITNDILCARRATVAMVIK